MWISKKQDEHLEEFKVLSLAEQKQHLCEILDKNQLYVNLLRSMMPTLLAPQKKNV
jgi:hypothetical protein